MAGWRVEVEVLVLRLLTDGDLGHRWVRGPAASDACPDERAVALVGCQDGLCHSTSWRRDGDGALVLTYAALPDPSPAEPAEPLGTPLVVAGGQPLRPAPGALAPSHVAAHAVRHLADLADRDPVVRAAGGAGPALWGAVVRSALLMRHELTSTAS